MKPDVVAQAGAVAFRRAGGGVRFLLVTSRRDPGCWVFPKGHIEAGEAAPAAALRELREEAGAAGRAGVALGTLTFRSGDEDVAVRYFLVEALDEGAAREGRRMQWLPLAEARALLSHEEARALLARAAGTLGLEREG